MKIMNAEDNHSEAVDENAASQTGEPREYSSDQAEQANAALIELGKEVEDLRDKLLRSAAEAENVRRRSQREVADAKSFSIANFARDMLGVADNLTRALEAIPDDARNSGDPGFAALIEGVELTQKSMHGALQRHGVQKLEPEGERFDPNFHQAMFEVPNADIPNNTVVQVVQAGYRIGERVLRPAMVGVSKGGPKAAPAATEAQTEHGDSAEPGPPDEIATRDA
ncbi:nucleotide exchange factor GrpE [Notoacmeibacter ruber]|uniref:Protein GrpE n=2 Tax=Notoacmeibacter ruber TaxID=2670375 RepID=A0A3L7JEU3_9HYPH|nr:nucleotide exchange factor GrpE [Notoacmeibacter ruber]